MPTGWKQMKGQATRSGVYAAVTAILANAAFAQGAGDRSTPVLEEVVVTAQKRIENLQDVPGTVSVVSTDQLDKLHVTQLADIASYVPGLQVDSLGTPGQTQIAIRGIVPLSANATVGVYIDDTPVGATSFHQRGGSYSFDLMPYDVKQVEVLSGPQGTLYGANALGGIVKYELVKPSLDETHLRVGANASSIENASGVSGGGRFFADVALVPDKLGAIFSYSREHTAGYIDNGTTGERAQNGDLQQVGRLSLRWKPSENLDASLNGLYQKIEADGNATVALDTENFQPIAGELSDNNARPNTFDSKVKYVSADVKWHASWADLTTAASWTDKTEASVQDLTLNVGLPTEFPLDLNTRKFTYEMRLASPGEGGNQWLVGVYYDHERDRNHQQLFLFDDDGTKVEPPLFAAALPSTYREYAAFGNITHPFSESFDVSLGVRYAYNDQDFTQLITIPALDPVPGTSSESVWTWSVKPRWHINSNTMAYAVVSSGYQAGGPNTALPNTDVPKQVNSSTVTNYEIGLKATTPDRRATIDLAVFQLNWKKIQLPATTADAFSYIANGGKARSRGASMETRLQATEHLVVRGNATYTDAKLTSDATSLGGANGDALPFVPKWAGSLGFSYQQHAFAEWSFDGGASVRATSERRGAGPIFIFTDQMPLDSYSAVDMHAALSNERYTVRLYGRNVFDKRAYLSSLAIPNGEGTGPVQYEGILITPRTIGLSFDAKF